MRRIRGDGERGRSGEAGWSARCSTESSCVARNRSLRWQVVSGRREALVPTLRVGPSLLPILTSPSKRSNTSTKYRTDPTDTLLQQSPSLPPLFYSSRHGHPLARRPVRQGSRPRPGYSGNPPYVSYCSARATQHESRVAAHPSRFPPHPSFRSTFPSRAEFHASPAAAALSKFQFPAMFALSPFAFPPIVELTSPFPLAPHDSQVPYHDRGWYLLVEGQGGWILRSG